MLKKVNHQVPLLNIAEFSVNTSLGNVVYHSLTGARIIQKPHKHDFFMLMVFKCGGGNHQIDFIDHNIAPFQIHLLFPEQVHLWDFDENTIAHQIMLSRPLFEMMVASLRFSPILLQSSPVLELNQVSFRKIIYEFEQVKLETESEYPFAEMIYSRIKIIMLLISEAAEMVFNQQPVFESNPILVSFRSLIDKHFRSEKMVSFYASELNISANYLNILCKRHLAVPATALIHERLILEIKRMLIATNIPLKAIAEELGFYDLSYFSKFFKKYTGSTPASFRKEL